MAYIADVVVKYIKTVTQRLRNSHTFCQVVYYLKIDFDRLKMCTVNTKATTKNIVITNPTKGDKRSEKIFSKQQKNIENQEEIMN